MRRTGAVFLLAPLAASLASSTPASRAPRVDLVKVQGVIDPAQEGYIRGSIQAAETDGATVVLQMDSLGSYRDAGANLRAFIGRASVPVVAWVGPTGARVAGGSLLMATAASVLVMAPGAGFGPVRPVDLGGAGRQLNVRERTLVRALASGAPDPRATSRRLTDGPAFPAGPALDAKLIAFAAPGIPTLLQKLDGREVSTGAGLQKLATLNEPGRPVELSFHEIGVSRRILHGVSTPGAVYMLLLLGVMGVAFELTQPAFGVAGIAGAGALALAGYGLSVVPVHWLGVALILGGMGLQGLDVLIRRVAAFTAAGTVTVGVGSVLAWHGVAHPIRVGIPVVVLATIATSLFFGFILTVALRSRHRIRAAQVGLVGLVGEVRTDLNPEGGVYVKGTLWRARSMDGPIPKGRRIRVRGIDGLILRVEEEHED